MPIFRKLSYQIAWRFTATVFALSLLVGAVYISTEFFTLQHAATQRVLQRTQALVTTITASNSALSIGLLSPSDQARVRLLAADGTPLFTGGFFAQDNVPFSSPRKAVFNDIVVQGQPYRMVSTPLVRDGQLIGYLQVAEVLRVAPDDVPIQAALFLVTALAISAITFYSGLRFAEASLVPVRESMQRLEQFTQDASHELRTPLSTLGSSLDLALKTKQYKEGILSAKQDLGEAQQLIDRLLELARLDNAHSNRERLSFTKLLEEMVERMRPLAEAKGVKLKLEAAQPVAIVADVTLLRQLVSNLLANALKFTPEGGEVTVLLKPGQLQVKDTGIGIEAEQLPYIFDRFYQGDASRSEKGFGLGLAFVQRTAHLHGWQVTAESRVGEGSTFTLTFTPTKSS